ncbi:type II secretion system F family protein, partial [Paraburkholderia sp. EG285A]|uniref:type II secretion system F family protein n=1 Tax=Paraburkholderia sp. EG285A TaxID=3237009 RepID=UPI0034D34062
MSAARAHRGPSEWRFVWRGLDASGTTRRGTLIALDAAAVRAALKRERITVLAIERRSSAGAPKARHADVTRFTRQLASLLRAGLPLANALDLLALSPGPNGMPRIAAALARDIAGGLRFADSLAQHPARFNALYCQLVAVGEASGALAAFVLCATLIAASAIDLEHQMLHDEITQPLLWFGLLVNFA